MTQRQKQIYVPENEEWIWKKARRISHARGSGSMSALVMNLLTEWVKRHEPTEGSEVDRRES
jgi:hypothetical protein